MRLLLSAMSCAKDDLGGNVERHVGVLAEARAAGCDLVVLPEMSLTGSVDPAVEPNRCLGIDDDAVGAVVAASADAGVGIVFGFAERRGPAAHITQAHASGGRLAAQRKRHLADDEGGFVAADETTMFVQGDARFGVVICAESTQPRLWDAVGAIRPDLICFCAAPGLHTRRTDEPSWRRGLHWWVRAGFADARRHAARLGVPVAMATQAGSAVDEDFPGPAALIGPTGELVAVTTDWRPATVVVDVPVRPGPLAGASAGPG